MGVAELLIDVIGPVVLLVGIGALTGRRLGIEIESLSRLAFWVIGPAFVFDVFTSTSLPSDVLFDAAIASFGGFVVAVLVGVGALAKRPVTERRAAGMMSGFGNVGNAGIAISVFAFGDAALEVAGLMLITINIAGITTGMAFAASSTHGPVTAIRRALVSPMPIAAALAILVNAGDLSVPTVVERSTGLLGPALIPVMLYTLGMQLQRSERVRFTGRTAVVAVAKLAVAPAAAALIASAVGLTGDPRSVVIIQSAMPPAVFCVLIAMEFDLEREAVTNDVVAVTFASLLTLPILLGVLT